MTVIPMLPTLPEVRCDQCRRVYTVNTMAWPIRGQCPKCGHEKFSTRMGGDGNATVVNV